MKSQPVYRPAGFLHRGSITIVCGFYFTFTFLSVLPDSPPYVLFMKEYTLTLIVLPFFFPERVKFAEYTLLFPLTVFEPI